MNGKVPGRILRVLAVVSALAIGGTYVAWRSADAEKKRGLERAESAEKAAEEEEMILMVGSKNPAGSLLTREMAMEEIDANWRTGSDFITPLAPSDDSILPEIKEIEEAHEQELLPSSKIGIIRLPAKEAEPKKKKDPKLLPSSKSIDSILKDLVPEKSE